MSDSAPAVDAAPANNPPVTIEYIPPADTQDALSIEDAVRMMSEPEKEQEAESAEPEKAATAEPEPAKADADQETDPGEETEANDQEPETPPIEPPRSWTKEAKERWASLPRDTQEYLAQREQERDREVRRSQNEAADQRKAMEAERRTIEQLKQQYETKLPSLVQTLESALQSEFSDVKSMADAERLQQEDPFRFQRWQLHQMRLAAAKEEEGVLTRQRESDLQAKWTRHVEEEGAKFQESLSAADKARLTELMNAAPDFLEDRGFTRQELTDLWQGKDKLSLHDHRLQSLILDGMKYRDMLKAPPKAVPKSAPPVQRPGAAQPRGAAKSQSIQALNQRLSETGSPDDAFALWMASRKAS